MDPDAALHADPERAHEEAGRAREDTTRSSLLTVEEHEKSATSCKQWLVLLAFSLNTALNAFLSVNFSVISHKTRDVLHFEETQVALLYTGFLLTVALGMLPGLFLVTNNEAIALALGVCANVASAWVRWLGVRSRSYTVVFVSAVLNAAGAWIILPLPAQLSQQRFPTSWWALTTSIAVQANYSGWLFGSVLPPALISDYDSMERFMFYQALCSLLVIVGFALFYRPVVRAQRIAGHHSRVSLGNSVLSSQGAPLFDEQDTAGMVDSHGGGAHAGGSIAQFCRTLHRFPRFGMQVLAYGILGGVSFALPGCDDALLEPHGFKSTTVSVVNSAFLGTGVISGVLLGAKCTPRNYGVVLKTLFVFCALALTAVAILTNTSALPPHDSTRNVVIVSCLFALVGMSSLGFIGLGIEAAALYPAGGAYVCFTIEVLIQIIGAVLNYVCHDDFGFVIFAVCAWVATLLVLFGYRPYPGNADAGTSRSNPQVSHAISEDAVGGSRREPFY